MNYVKGTLMEGEEPDPFLPLLQETHYTGNWKTRKQIACFSEQGFMHEWSDGSMWG